MAGEFKIKVSGAEALAAELRKIAPELRKGPAMRALRAGAKPVLEKAIAETPILDKDIYRKGKLIRRRGTLRRALRIRSSKDTNRTGDVGVFVNIKPLHKNAIAEFKSATGRPGSQNADDPYYWRWVHFATKRNKNPKPFLTRAGSVLESASLPIVSNYLKGFFEKLNAKGRK